MSSDPLLLLRDLHLPSDPGWWPPAPAYWVVLGALILGGVLIAWLRRRPSLRRAAHRELREIARAHARHSDDHRLLAEAARLLRRVARARHGTAAAALGAEAWAAHLARHAPAGCDPTTWQLLALQRYRMKPPAIDARRLLADCRRWLGRVVA